MRVSDDVQGVLKAAYLDAKERKHEFLTPEHILYACLHFDVPREILRRCGADPDDIRYATLRWNTSDQTGYGAIGPSKVDPRTGEILDADILFEANMMLGRRALGRRIVNPVTAAEAFESTLGVGTTFRVLLPAHADISVTSAAFAYSESFDSLTTTTGTAAHSPSGTS